MQGCVHFNVGLDNCCACHMLQAAERGVEVEVGEGAAAHGEAGEREGRQLGNYSKPQARDMSDSYQQQQLRAVTA